MANLLSSNTLRFRKKYLTFIKKLRVKIKCHYTMQSGFCRNENLISTTTRFYMNVSWQWSINRLFHWFRDSKQNRMLQKSRSWFQRMWCWRRGKFLSNYINIHGFQYVELKCEKWYDIGNNLVPLSYSETDFLSQYTYIAVWVVKWMASFPASWHTRRWFSLTVFSIKKSSFTFTIRIMVFGSNYER